MSYQVLARKWRPANFQELVGQEHVQRALVNALNDDRLHHAYLFTGTRGVGKTTIARIFSKSLNCETGITSTPCGKCSTCRDIAEGCYIDLIEVDAASRTGVDDTRDLLENVQYAPTRGRYKVYLIDEVHMFSKSSFNALLKTLEEPPPHVKFLLATTDPQKLPVTVLSRCLQFNLKRLPVSLIINHLQHILTQEKVEFNVTALQLIAQGADGSMRDALSLLDQALAFGGGTIREQEVRDMLGTVSRERVLTILQALLTRNAQATMAEVAALTEFSPDYENVLAELLSVLHHMNLGKVVPQALDDFVSAKEKLLALSEQVSVEDLQLFYQIGLIGRRDLPLAPDARSGFEMVLLRMLAFRPTTADKSISQGHASVASAVSPANVATKSQTAAAQTAVSQVSESGMSESGESESGVSRSRVSESRVSESDPASFDSSSQASAPIPEMIAPVKASKSAAQAARDAINGVSSSQKINRKPDREPGNEPGKESDGALEKSVSQQSEQASITKTHAHEEAVSAAVSSVNNNFSGSVESEKSDWRSIVQALSLGGLVKQLAMNCAFKQREGNTVFLQLAQGHSNLITPQAKQRLQQALGEYFNIDAQLTIELFNAESAQDSKQQTVAETPAQTTQREQAQRQQQSEQSMNEDSFVQILKDNFNAEIIPGSVKPVS